MPESQENKVDKIVEMVKPSQPEVVVPAQLQNQDINNVTPISQEPQAQQEVLLNDIRGELNDVPLSEFSGNSGVTLDDMKNERGTLDKLKEYYDILDVPSEKAKEGLHEVIAKTAELLPWPEADSQSVGVNFMLNLPRFTADVGAEFAGEQIAPESLALMVGGKLATSALKTKFAKDSLKTFTQTIIDYKGGKLANWIVKPFTYKFGLPNKQEYLELASERLRNIKEGIDKANKVGATLHSGLSVQAQSYAREMLTSGGTREDILLLAKSNKAMMKEMGIANPKKFVKDVVAARKLIDDASARFIDEGLRSGYISTDLAAIIEGNKGKYLPRLYKIFENKEWMKHLDDGKVSMEELLGTIEETPNFLKRVAGYSDDDVNAFHAMTLSKQKAVLDKFGRLTVKPISKSSTKLSAWFGFLGKKKNISKDVRAGMGEILTAARPVAKAYASLNTSTENIAFFNKIASNPEWAQNIGKKTYKDWVYIPGDKFTKKIMGPLSGMHVHPEIAKDVRSLYTVKSDVEKCFDVYRKVLGLWKSSKVLYSPATHVRNMAANSIMLDLSGVPLYRQPDLLYKAYKQLSTKGKYYKEAIQHGLIGGDYATHELATFGDAAVSEFGSGGIKNLIKKIGGPSQSGVAKAYAFEENLFKLAKHIHSREAGISAREAALEGEKWLFNYGKVSTATKFMRDNPFYTTPFITYTAKSLPRILETAIKSPYKLYKYNLFLNAINETSMQKTGVKPEEVEYIKRKRGMGVLAPMRDQKGDPVWLGLNNIFPWGDLENWMRGHQQGSSEMPQMIQPGGVLKIGADVYYNRNTFTGKDIAPENTIRNKNMLMLSYVYKSAMPPIMPAIAFTSGTGVQTAGYSAQKIADGAYADDVLDRDLANVFLAKKKAYFGQSRHLSFAILDAVFGLRVEPQDIALMKHFDNADYTGSIKELMDGYIAMRKDAGLRTEQYQIEIAKEQFKDRLDELKAEHHRLKDELEREAIKSLNKKQLSKGELDEMFTP